MVYFDDSTHIVTKGAVVYADDLNAPLAAIESAFAALTEDIQNSTDIHYATDTGIADAYAVALDPAPTVYTEGLLVWLKPLNVNTGTATLAVSGLSAISILRTGGEALQAGDLAANYYIGLKYNSGVFQIISGTAISEANALASATAAAASAVITSADVVLTNADVVLTNADVVLAEAAKVAAEAAVSLGVRADAITTDFYTTSDAVTSEFLVTSPCAEENMIVFMNSRKLRLDEDYEADHATIVTKITLGTESVPVAAASGDEIEIISFNTHNVINHTVASHSDTSATGPELNTLTDGSDASSLHVHTVVSLDTTATGANLTTLTDGSDADALHDHDGISENTAARHAESHTVASHSDTTATGAELETLTNGSSGVTLDALHKHSGLELIEEGINFGWRLIGRDATWYGTIGEGATDLSFSGGLSSDYGATGDYSLAVGGSVVAQNTYQVTIGKHNVGSSGTTILEVGIGTSAVAKANALEIHTDGKVFMAGLPTSDPGIAGSLWIDTSDSRRIKSSAG